jgi:hypothetical protein
LIQRIVTLDIPQLLSGIAPPWVSRTACAMLGIGLAVVLRFVVERIAPGVAPFAFVYPIALLVTLLGGWQAGVGAMAVSEWLAWVFVIRAPHTGQQIAAIVLVTVTVTAVIAAGQGFRTAAQRGVAERNAKLAERELLFRELQHRVSNDFALVNSLLDM